MRAPKHVDVVFAGALGGLCGDIMHQHHVGGRSGADVDINTMEQSLPLAAGAVTGAGLMFFGETDLWYAAALGAGCGYLVSQARDVFVSQDEVVDVPEWARAAPAVVEHLAKDPSDYIDTPRHFVQNRL